MEYKKIYVEKNGRIGLNVEKNFALWEQHDDGVATHIEVDTAQGAKIIYEDIPLIIEYLERVHDVRVNQQQRALIGCKECGRALADEH